MQDWVDLVVYSCVCGLRPVLFVCCSCASVTSGQCLKCAWRGSTIVRSCVVVTCRQSWNVSVLPTSTHTTSTIVSAATPHCILPPQMTLNSQSSLTKSEHITWCQTAALRSDLYRQVHANTTQQSHSKWFAVLGKCHTATASCVYLLQCCSKTSLLKSCHQWLDWYNKNSSHYTCISLKIMIKIHTNTHTSV